MTSHAYAQAPRVRATTLTPRQQPTSKKLQIACDFYQHCFIKHPGISEFHSRAEYLHAGLLEGTPSVPCFVPQPYKFFLNGQRYTPDCYHVDGAKRIVTELKPRGEFDAAKRIPLEQFFALHGMQFVVVSNESVYEREIEAENWIDIVRSLYRARDCTTDVAEVTVLDKLYQSTELSVGDFVDPGDREGTFTTELALLRLLHRGLIQADLNSAPLDYDTGVTLCTSPGVNA